ncbi:transglutaminase domain-containing protein [Streptomyces sp. ISL-66]|uniref:transglutaminase domain-containing protein n=1 Tax=Streptomyces sp. ISL-66 TaxID=2819186 RepID=UPI001BEC5740|nr:transglutaminase domain-containing protein [Streptomyces sp. ISL-66]MBT2472893.1 transglutaminase domain-containing protein [Streptomyces sp. ISL-66]
MTSSLLRPRGRKRTVPAPAPAHGAGAVAGGSMPTRILDWHDPRVTELVQALGVPADAHPVQRLREAHRWIAATLRPVYSVQDERPVSQVLRLGRGSCSQRLAVLEAVARATGTPTRVRGLVVDGAFWYPRFPRLRPLVPDQVLLAWPEFRLPEPEADSSRWLTVSQLFDLDEPGRGEGGGFTSTGGFTNTGPETLFEALSRTAIDWDGAPPLCPAEPATCDLSAYVLADLGHFDSRDTLFARHGQTLCALARTVAEPVLGRRAAGA